MAVTAFNGYPISIVVAVAFHSLIIAVLLYMERADTETIDMTRPPVVKAILVNENPQQVNAEREEQTLRRIQEQRENQRREEQRRQEQQRQEQQRQEAEAAAEAERRRVQERQRQEQQRQQEVAAEQEAERRQQEERQREEQRRQEQQQREAEQRRQQELAAQQAAAEAQAQADAEARERAETEAELVVAYSARIHDVIQNQWSRPPSARNGMEVVLRMRLAPTGDVLGDVEIVRSSGDYAFDQAAVNAVVRAAPFRQELQGMPPRMFERNFRSLLLTFRPEDLLN